MLFPQNRGVIAKVHFRKEQIVLFGAFFRFSFLLTILQRVNSLFLIYKKVNTGSGWIQLI